jgi:chorismate synthase
MQLETDELQILSGLDAAGLTIGSPVALLIKNQAQVKAPTAAMNVPRPGHADLAGAQKYNLDDLYWVAERASARETAARVAAGAIAKALLTAFGVELSSHPQTVSERELAAAKAVGDTLGGTVIVRACGLLPGLGSYTEAARRLDGRLAAALLSIPSVKGIEIGDGFSLAALHGSEAADPLMLDLPTDEPTPARLNEPLDEPTRKPTPAPTAASAARACAALPKLRRSSNRAGGLEGGMTTGEELRLRLAVKPVPTTGTGLPSVDLVSAQPAHAPSPRHDTLVVEAVGVIAEAEVALVLSEALQEKFGGDCLSDMLAAADAYQRRIGWR